MAVPNVNLFYWHRICLLTGIGSSGRWVEGALLESVLSAGINNKIANRRFRFDVSPFFDLMRTVKKYKPDIIHSWGWMSTLAAAPIARYFRVPHVNGIVRGGKPYYYRGKISKLLTNVGDVVISNSRAGLTNWGVHPSRGVVIYNGFDNERIKKHLKITNRDACNRFTVVMVARMVKAKDFRLYISAIRKLIASGITNWKYFAIGQGEEREFLIKENSDLIEGGILEFPVAGLEVMHFLDQSDVGVLLTNSAYHEEGCSNTIMEYMACGLPVIATDSGGNRELIENDITGFVIPDGNADELIGKLLWISEHPADAQMMGEKGRNKLLREFTIQKMIRETVNLYETLIDRAKVSC